MQTVFNLLRNEFPAAELCQAAPDLLASLEKMLAWAILDEDVPGNPPIADDALGPHFLADVIGAREAIAKAKGGK